MARSRKSKSQRAEAGAAAAEITPTPGKRSRRSPAKRALFYVVTVVLFFGILELLLALLGIKPLLVEKDPYVGFSSQLRLFVPTSSGEQLRTAVNKLALFNDQVFPRQKRPGTVRVFTLGGSVTYGRPFEDGTSFSGWLRTYLDNLDTGQKWEVVNAGGISYASYRVATLMEELVDYEPDLFIIYSGHNEFLERRTYAGLIEEPEALTRTKLLLQRSRLWSLGRRIVASRERRAQRSYQLTGEVQELLDTSAGLDYYFRDEPFRRQVLGHYRFNLQRMIRLARVSGAAVILVTIPSNEKDFAPFKSQHREGLSEAQRRRHAELLARASQALESGDAELAQELAAEAVALDPLFADGHYVLGRTRQSLGLYEQAAESFRRAIQEDVCPLRALAETNELIFEAAGRDGVPLVDFRSLLKSEMLRRSGHGNLGDELFLDHAHPTVEANGILARALVDQMAEMGMLDPTPGWEEQVAAAVRDRVMSRVDAEAQARAYKNLSKVLIWAGKRQEAEKYVRLAETVLDQDWEVRYNAGIVQLDTQQYELAISNFQAAIRLNPQSAMAHDLLAVAYAESGQPQLAVEAGRRAVELAPEVAGAWNNLGTFYGALQDHVRALEATREALRLNPDFAEAHNNLGKVYFDLGRLDEALRSFERAAELRPNYVEAMINRGLVLGELGRYGDSVEIFSSAINLQPRLPAAHVGKAKALLALGELGAATASLETVIALDGEHLEAYELLAQTLVAAKQPARAEAVLRRGLAAKPEAARLRHLYGRALAQQGRIEAAIAELLEAIALDPDLLAVRMDLGNLRMAQGSYEQAILVYRQALERQGRDDRLHHILGTALLIAGRIEEGRSELERALEINPANPGAANDLATVYENQGRLEEALELYRLAARLDPSLTSAREAASRLEQR